MDALLPSNFTVTGAVKPVVFTGSVMMGVFIAVVRLGAKKKYAKTQMKISSTMAARAPKVNMVPLRFASLSSFFAVVILKMPMMTKMKAIKTSTRKMRFTRVMRTLTTSPAGTPKNPKMGLGLSGDEKAKNANRIPIKRKMEQPNALKHPIMSRLLDFPWSLGNATAAAAGFGAVAVTGFATGAVGWVAAGGFGFGCCGTWLSIL